MPPEPPAAKPPIDPRLRARMVQVRRDAGRRRLKLIAVAAAAAVIIAAGLVASRLPLLTVGTVQVTGAQNIDRATLDHVVSSLRGSPMLSVDTGAARRALAASPWVERVSIRKDWPRTIRIDLAERTPIAGYLAEDGKFRVIDDSGHVIAALDGQPVDYLTIVPAGRATGAGIAVAPGGVVPPALTNAARLARTLPDELRTRVAEIGVDQDANLELHLRPTGRVLLGPIDGMRDKLLAVLALSHQVNLGAGVNIDARTPSRVTCTPATACKSLTGATP
jgi:cell division protein FtsQ